MPLHRFVIRCGPHVIPDREGRQVRPRDSLMRRAREHVEALRKAAAVSFLDDPRCRIEVLNEQHELVAEWAVSEL